MFTNNQIFGNCFIIIHYHLTKVSARINKSIVFGRNELYIPLSTVWIYFQSAAQNMHIRHNQVYYLTNQRSKYYEIKFMTNKRFGYKLTAFLIEILLIRGF